MKKPYFTSLFLLISLLAGAQTTAEVPSMEFYPPEALSLMTYVDYPVSPLTGTPDISIPLYTIKSGSLELPISLHFHMADFNRSTLPSGVTGAGWSLSTDFLITRDIFGLDDFSEEGYLYNGIDHPYQTGAYSLTTLEKENLAMGYQDGEPDRFFYQTLEGTGTFYIVDQGSRIQQVPITGTRIDFAGDSNPFFTVMDPHGRIYHFPKTYEDGYLLNRLAWRCASITNAAGTDSLTFSYLPYTEITRDYSSSVDLYYNISLSPSYSGQPFTQLRIPRLEEGNWTWYVEEKQTVVPPGYNPSSYIGWTDSPVEATFPYKYKNVNHLSRIDFLGGYVLFNYSTHQGRIGTYRVLDRIEIYAVNSTAPIRTVDFNYSTAEVWERESVFLADLTINETEHYSFKYPSISRGEGSSLFWGYGRYGDQLSGVTLKDTIHCQESLNWLANLEHYEMKPSYSLENKGWTSIYGLGGNVEITYPTGGRTVFDFDADQYISSSGGHKYVPTSRISEITWYDRDSTVLKQVQYYYGTNENGAGIILCEPKVSGEEGQITSKTVQTIHYYHDSNTGLPATYLGAATKVSYLSGTVLDKGLSLGNKVYYPEVAEYLMDDGAPAEKKVYKYNVFGPNGNPCPNILSGFPYGLLEDCWWFGTPQSITSYRDFGGGSFAEVEQSSYTYSCHFTSDKFLRSRAWPTTLAVEVNGNFSPEDTYAHSVYNTGTAWQGSGCLHLDSEVNKVWMDDGTEFTTSYQYFYDSPNGYTPNRRVLTTPDGIIVTDNTLYAEDLADSVLVARNLIALPLQYEQSNGNRVVAGHRYVYDEWGRMIRHGEWESTNASDGHYVERDSIRYDAHGRIVEIRQAGQAPITWIWGYSGMYPVISIKGAGCEEVWASMPQGALEQIYRSSGYPSGGSAGNWLFYLRVQHPTWHVTDAVYQPLVGISHLTDPMGTTTGYTYNSRHDLSARLIGGEPRQEYFNSFADSITAGGRAWTKVRTYRTVSDFSDDIVWYNGIGLPVQTNAERASSEGKDIITPYTYDYALRSDAQGWHPYVSPLGDGSFRPNALTEQRAAFASLYGTEETDYSFSVKEYERSPRNWIRKTQLPGKMNTSGRRYTENKYYYNNYNRSDHILKLDVLSDGRLSVTGYWPMAKIKCVQTEDPDLRKKETYVDGLGRTVLERVFLGSQALETYYVYDVYGRLRWITTPRGSQLLREVIGSTHLQDSEFAQSFCYVYNYDGRGNVIEKRIPGAGAIFLSYDKGDRVISQEDGLLRAAGGPLITEYDIFGREVRETHPDSTVLFKKVYDVYPNDSPTGLDFQMSHLPGLPLSVDTPTGQLTYEEYTIIGGEGTIKRAMYYDWYGNNIQTVELYPDGGILRISRTFDWLGNVLMAKHTFSSSDGTCTDALTDTFTYDSRGRCISEYSGLNNGAGVSRSRSYDVLGRVGKEWTGYSGVEEKRSYNPQGWLTGQTVTKMETDTLFYSTLNYYDIPTSSTFPKASRTGNISKWEWKQRGAEKAQYAFNYDSAGRLIVASETSGPQGYFSFSENYDYDFNTVLMRIVRTGYKPNNKAWVSFYQGRRQENSYDANGNVTFEPLGGLRMEYNLMNLPQQIITASQDTVRYTYSADGVKLSATADSFSYYYRGPFRYRIDTSGGMVLESSAAGACGRIVRQANGTMAPLWFIIDHLGSVRVVRDLYGNVVEQADYSPYGERINQEYLVSGSSDYLFGGKESQQAFGIPLYDSGARFQFLDGIFTSIDPLCEQTPSINPYTYCAGNPVNLVDPTGENWYSYIDETGTIRYVYYEGQLSQDIIKEKGYTDLGYTFMDEQNGMYYSLFGSILSKKDSDGNSSLNYFLNKKIDDLLIKVYSSTEGEGTVSFYSGMKAGCYPFTYNGRHFSSRKDGTLFWAFNNVENSRLHILQMPPKKERRFGGYNNAPNWFGSFMILSNNKNYYAIQINYSASDGARLNQAIVKLFKEK